MRGGKPDRGVERCTVAGCGSPREGRGLCNKHYLRARKHGDPLHVTPRSVSHAKFTDAPTYGGMHHRVRKLWGSPSEYRCQCGEWAAEWAYDHTDPREVAGERKRGFPALYSLDVNRYMPMCKPCHRKFDSHRDGVLSLIPEGV